MIDLMLQDPVEDHSDASPGEEGQQAAGRGGPGVVGLGVMGREWIQEM